MLLFIGLWLASVNGVPLTGSLRDQALEYHNAARRAVRNCEAYGIEGQLPAPVSMPDLEWSDALAATASLYAELCGVVNGQNAGYCTHSRPAGWTPNPSYASRGITAGPGENIGCPWPGVTTFGESHVRYYLETSMIIKERDLYRYSPSNSLYDMCWMVDPEGIKPSVWGWFDCGHYSQIIWADTRQVGCAYATCNNRNAPATEGAWLVCHYFPPGNYDREPYQSGGSCGGGAVPAPPSAGPSGCDLEISGLSGETFSGNNVAVMNGQWVASNGGYTKGSLTLALASGGYWEVDGSWQNYGYCYADDVFSCNGNWRSDYRSSSGAREWTSYGSASFGACGALANVDHPCFENFASVMQFRVNASHAGHEFERVALAGCHNNAPQWTAQRSGSLSLRLMFEDGQWVIYEESLISEAKYVCAEEGLDACVEGTWQEIVTQAVVGNDVSAAGGNATTPGLGGSVAYEQTYVILPDAAIVAVVADGVEGGKKSTGTAVIAVVVIVVFVVALVLVGVCCWMRRKKQHVEVGFDDGAGATQGGATAGTTEVEVMMEVEN